MEKLGLEGAIWFLDAKIGSKEKSKTAISFSNIGGTESTIFSRAIIMGSINFRKNIKIGADMHFETLKSKGGHNLLILLLIEMYGSTTHTFKEMLGLKI